MGCTNAKAGKVTATAQRDQDFSNINPQ